jgi:hypothetical protein
MDTISNDKLIRKELQRFCEEDGQYALYVNEEVMSYAQRIAHVIAKEGGTITPTEEEEEVRVAFPEGTSVVEYDVPPERNVQGFISTDAYVTLPSGTRLYFHQHGISSYLYFARL